MDADGVEGRASARHRRVSRGAPRRGAEEARLRRLRSSGDEDFPDLLRLLADDSNAAVASEFRAAVRFAERASVGDDLKLRLRSSASATSPRLLRLPQYWHVSHRTVKDKILFKIKWSRDPMLAVARAHPDGLAKEMLDGEEAVKSVDHATGAADRAPAPEIDERRAVDDAAAPARPPRPPRREPEPLSEMEALRRAQEASLAEARAPRETPRTSSNRTSWRIV